MQHSSFPLAIYFTHGGVYMSMLLSQFIPLIGKDPGTRQDWRQEKKGTIEWEMVGWHHQLYGHEFKQAPGIGDGQGGRACCSAWGHRELDMTERLNWAKASVILKIVKVLVAQPCPTLCDPMDCSLLGSSVHGIFQARILEWVAIPFLRGSYWPRDWTQVSCIAVRFFYHLSHRGSPVWCWDSGKRRMRRKENGGLINAGGVDAQP